MNKPLLAFILLTATPWALADTSKLSGQQAADGLNRLDLSVDVGSAKVQGADTDTISWTVELEPQDDWFSSEKSILGKLKDAKVQADIDDGELSLEMDYPGALDGDDVEATWVVTVPRAFAVSVDLGVGDMKITAVSGGVEGNAGVGGIEINVPGGAITAEVGVGDVDVTTATTSLGGISLEAGVGDASADIRGVQHEGQQEYGPSSELKISGDGSDNIELEAGVGDLDLTVTGN